MKNSPTTDQKLDAHTPMGPAVLEAILARAVEAQKAWAERELGGRVGVVRALGAVLKEAQMRERCARQMTLEMGKPIKESYAEVDKCAFLCQWYADEAAGFLADESVSLTGMAGRVRFEAMGLILSIMPWNFPFWQALRFAVPALLVGNGSLLRHASNVTGCALLIEECWTRAGLPAGVFTTIICSHSAVSGLIADPRVRGVSFTGSTEVGERIARECGGHLKKCVLELGGSDPFIVLADASLEEAARAAATSRLLNGGQSCISAKRFLVHQSLLRPFLALFKKELQARKLGDPQLADTDLGPLVHEEAAKEMERWVEEARAMGAEIPLSGTRSGAFYPPAIVVNPPAKAQVACSEVFGPVAVVFGFESDEEAAAIANGTEFGLAASVWSKDVAHAERVARQLECGAVHINGFSRSDPRMPFGGAKRSGMGRELGRYGMLEFANIKSYHTYS